MEKLWMCLLAKKLSEYRAQSCKVIAKTRRVQFFMLHSVYTGYKGLGLHSYWYWCRHRKEGITTGTSVTGPYSGVIRALFLLSAYPGPTRSIFFVNIVMDIRRHGHRRNCPRWKARITSISCAYPLPMRSWESGKNNLLHVSVSFF